MMMEKNNKFEGDLAFSGVSRSSMLSILWRLLCSFCFPFFRRAATYIDLIYSSNKVVNALMKFLSLFLLLIHFDVPFFLLFLCFSEKSLKKNKFKTELRN